MITIEQQGLHWIASDGDQHAEGEDPMDALLGLECGPLDDADVKAEGEVVAMEALAEKCLDVVKLLYSQAPMLLLQGTIECLNHAWENFKEHCDDDGPSRRRSGGA